ncbi:cytochrome p450 4c1 [Lasius niger]|uniref:Cytochrome p450 4c1 n=1 Tax=Lasius niger TaxID=67767 RepID=A0A0J7KLJ7_LASNI|nr:cytochrome p450 4c1 [Lasius niger]
MRPWFYNDLLFALSPQGRKQKKALKILHGFTENIIAERKLYHERTNDRYLRDFENDEQMKIDNAEEFGIKKKQLAMLDILIMASRDGSLTDLDIREEVDTFMFEGHDTTATGITFALLLLAEHKDIQERVRVEINTVMQENGGKLTMRSLQNLPYLDRCLKEALRLYPSVFLISRKAAEDVKLQSYVVPAGTTLHLNIYGVHRDPNFWPNPEVFDPDRFLPERIQNRHPYSYLPFSAGPRNCIGQRFGMLELKAMVAPLVHNFYLEPVDYLKDVRLRADIIIRPSHPIIAERKLYHERTNDRYLRDFENDEQMKIDNAEEFGIKKKQLAMLDILIMASRDGSLTDLDIREEVDTFMFEGHDTTATGITFALLLLAEHKDIQERVRVEINTVMQENGGKLTMRSLQNLPYLDRCLKEALRLYPSVFLISRKAAEDVKLQSYVVPAGTTLHLNIYGVHRDPNFWPNPEVFDPDRFLPERIQNRHPYSYLPFSAGPRNCIGQRFGMLELKAMVAPLVHNFYLEPVDYLKDVRLRADIIIRPSHPVRMRFIPIRCKHNPL